MPRKKKVETEDAEMQQAVEVVTGEVEGRLSAREEAAIREEAYNKSLMAFEWDKIPTDVRGATGTLTRAFRRHRYTSGMRSFTSGAELQGAIDAFFDMVFEAQSRGVDILPDIELLASFLGVTRNTLFSWLKGENNPDFVPVLDLAFNDIATGKKQYALQTKVAPLVYLSDMQNNHGYVANQNKTDMQITVRQEVQTEKQLIENANLLP